MDHALCRPKRCAALASGLAIVALAQGARAQTRSVEIEAGAGAIVLLTRDTHTPGDRALTEAYLTQPVLHGSLRAGWLHALGTLNVEGLTLRRGELDLGEWGEGYVDRRHPHAYVHELMVGAERDAENSALSLYAGRGFVPFGSDDPMVRPFVSYPVDHHLAQILERLAVIGAARVGPLVAEASTFDGDEPLDPSTPPRFNRFGDSWAVRGTMLGDRLFDALRGAQLSVSYAAVKSPEYREGSGLDQRKIHTALRLTGERGLFTRYALLEAARTTDLDRGRALYHFDAWLAEGALCRREIGVALRWERSDRPEEERLLDLFRSARPATDLSILGVTRWTTVTAALALPGIHSRVVRAGPFVEIARLTADRTTAALFDPSRFYGATAMWRVDAGLRIAAGHQHGRMGRYGTAAVLPVMTDHDHARRISSSNRCFS
jgi:hypothetical protein